MKVFITKYALTRGILEYDAHSVDESHDVVVVKVEEGHHNHFSGKDWHKTRHEAVLRATEMRERAIVNTEKKLAKLKEMTFV